MPKEYKSIEVTVPDLVKLVTDPNDKMLFMITNQILNDSSVAGVVPIQSHELQKSPQKQKQKLKKGIIFYDEVYAKSVWKRNKTGIPEWTQTIVDKNMNKYEKQIVKGLNIEKKDIFK